MFIQVHCKYCKIPELMLVSACGFIQHAWNHTLCKAELHKQVEISVFLPSVPFNSFINYEEY